MKQKLTVDIHTHTVASGHAYGTIRENALAASQIGLTGLGMSDHAPGISGHCDPFHFSNLRAIPRQLYGVNIYYGCENNVTNDGEMTLPEWIIKRLDYNIVGIHGTCYDDQGVEKNTENLIRCMAHPKTFFVSHPDDSTWPVDYEKLVKAAVEYGVALEVNNSTFTAGYRVNWKQNILTYLDLCMKYRCSIFVGSDAHDPSRIGHFEKAVELLDEIGFDEDLIVNNSEEKFRKFIGFRD